MEAAELRKTFGNAVRRHRQRLGMSQRALARRQGVSQRLLSAIEMGSSNCTICTMARIAEAVGADVPAMLSMERAD